MGARRAFWDSIWTRDGEHIAWPEDARTRARLARRIVGATWIGAVESVLERNLSRLHGEGPEAGATNYQEQARLAEVCASLSDEQREAVSALLQDTARGSSYWPLAKLRNLPDVLLDVTLGLLNDEYERFQTEELSEDGELHAEWHGWVAEFGELLK